MSWDVRRASMAEVAELRRDVLRPGEPLSGSGYVEDDVALHLAALEGGRVVGCATFFPQAFPGPGEEAGPADALIPAEAAGLVAWRLRGMATDPAEQSAGIGSAVLRTGLGMVAAAGGGLVWCNARTVALRFYARHGFVTVGSEFLTGGAVKVPHYRAWVPLKPQS